MTLRALIVGKGKMGMQLMQLAPQHDISIAQVLTRHDSYENALSQKVDVIIDFSSPYGQKERIEKTLDAKIPLIIGTTGWDEDKKTIFELVDKKKGALMYSANFSLGVAIFKKIVEKATALLGQFKEYDISLLEKHHRQKKDHPSGTAKELVELVLKNTPHKKEALFALQDGAISSDLVQVASLRSGSIIGEHELLFDSPIDSIELIHRAKNRDGFAQGALVAAKWIIGKTGVFTVDDML